jgi:hypothetical protein
LMAEEMVKEERKATENAATIAQEARATL